MDQLGFFSQDVAEAAQAFDQQVDTKKLFGGAEGLEICAAGVNPGIGAGLRRMQAMNRIDIPMLWRAMVRRGDGKKHGPTVALLAPRGGAPAQAEAKLAAAGLPAEGTTGEESYDVAFPIGTSSTELVQYAVRALTAMGYQPTEWQWTVRPKGVYPR